MVGFLRSLTNQKVMGDSTQTVSEALKLYDRWMRDPQVELLPEPPGLDMLFRQALEKFSAQPATKAIADCYLVGFRGGWRGAPSDAGSWIGSDCRSPALGGYPARGLAATRNEPLLLEEACSLRVIRISSCGVGG